MDIPGPRWICEYCFRTVGGNHLPDGWILVWGGGVCPECQEKVPGDGGYFKVPGGKYAFGPDPRRVDKSPERPLSAQETAEFAVGDPFKEHGLLAAGKKLCGMCHNKAKGEWRCLSRSFPASDLHCPAINGECRSFFPKPQLARPPQPKKKPLPVPPGVKFLYFGRPRNVLLAYENRVQHDHKGVVTVAWITPAPGILHLGFSFCSPKDGWCKVTGRDMAAARLIGNYLTVPYLYSPKRTVREVTRAVMQHDWRILFGMANYVQSDLRPFQRSVPGWTKDLEARRVSEFSELFRFRGPDHTHIGDTFAFMAPFFKTPRRKGKSLAEKLMEHVTPEAKAKVAARLEDGAIHERLLRHKAGHAPKYAPILSLNSLLRILADIGKLDR